MQHKIFVTLVIILLSASVIGCGRRTQVSGTVTFEDGTLLTVGNIKARTGDNEGEIRGNIAEDGTFVLFEVKPGDGIPAGKQYKVWIVNAIEKVPSTEMMMIEGRSIPAPPTNKQLIHRDYTTEHSTPLTLDVPKGSSNITYDITVKVP